MADMEGKLVVIGLDGGDWDIIDPLIEEGALPAFKRVKDQGAWAGLRSTIPALTAPSWNSIFTGTNPGKHGVFDFRTIVDGKAAFLYSDDMAMPYLWEVLRGKRTLAFNIPCSYPPRPCPGSVLVSGFPAPDQGFCYPADVEKEIRDGCPDYTVHKSNVNDPLWEADEGFRETCRRDILGNLEMKKAAARRLMETREWDCAIIVFSATDWAQHIFMHGFVEASRKKETPIGGIYSSIDSFLAPLMESGASVILVSDHGFVEIGRRFALNEHLRRKGILKERRRLIRAEEIWGSIRRPLLATFPILHAPLALIKKTMLAGAGGQGKRRRLMPIFSILDSISQEGPSSFLFSADGAFRLHPGHEDRAIIEELESTRDQEGRKVIKKVVRREDAYRGPKTHQALELVVIPEDDVHLMTDLHVEVHQKVDPVKDKNGGHREMGIFAAYSSRLERRGRLEDLWVEDVALAVLGFFGQGAPAHMDGTDRGIFGVATKDGGEGMASLTKAMIRGGLLGRSIPPGRRGRA